MNSICSNCHKLPINVLRSKHYCTDCLDKAKERQKKYVKTITKEERKIRARRRYLKHKDEILIKAKEYITFHPEVRRKSARNYYRTHKEQISAYNKEYKKAHRDRYNFLSSRWAKEHPERARLDAHIKRVRTNNVGGKYTLLEWKQLCDQYNNECLWCHKRNILLTVDHVVPISRGGTNFIDNIQPLCKPCNSKKSLKILDFRPFGTDILEWT